MFLKNFTQFLVRQNLQHMIVHVTNHCNFRCEHCFIDFSPKRDLKLEDYQVLGRTVGKLFWLDIAGGEPFLRKDLADLIACFETEILQIPTNASQQRQIVEGVREIRQRIRSEITISLSLDGLKERHERIRKAPGNWDQVWDTFEKLRALRGIKVKINTVVNQDNYHELIDLMREVRRRKPDFHSIILLRGNPMNPDFRLPPLEELRKLGPRIFEILETYDYGKGGVMARVLRNYHRYLWNVSLETVRQETQVIPCLAGRAHMVVMGNGDVSSCEMLPAVGNIRDQSWNEILEGETFQRQKQDIRDKKCFCTHNCAMLDSILFRPASLPHLIHEDVNGHIEARKVS